MSTLNTQFKSMTEAQKAFVLNMLVNRMFQDPKHYGLSDNGILRVGANLDFGHFFENTEEIKFIFDKARQTITEGSQKEKLILENNAKIAAWVKEHPGENIDESKVSEILAIKPKAEILEKPQLTDEVASVSKEPGLAPELDVSERMNALEDSKPEVEMVRSSIPDKLEAVKAREPIPAPPEIDVRDANLEQIEELQRARERLAELEGSTQVATAGGLSVAGAAALTNIEDYKRKRDEQKTLEDIERARGGNALEEFKKKQEANPYVERSLRSDMESLKKEYLKKPDHSDPVEEALISGVNEFFTEREGWSIAETPGIQSRKWNFIRRLSFSKLLKYYTGDSNESGLRLEEMDELRKHEKYRDFVRHVQEFIRVKTNGDVLLFKESDTIEDALRKVISHIHEQYHNPLRRAA